MVLKNSKIAATLIGIAHFIFLTFCWKYISIYVSHIPRALIFEISESLKFSLFDIIVNILLSIPAAYLIYKLQPRKLLLYMALAIVPSFLWLNINLIIEPSSFLEYVPWYTFLPGWLYLLFSIPIAILIIHRLTIRLTRTAATEPSVN